MAYVGNTTGTDSAAILATLTDMAAAGGGVGGGGGGGAATIADGADVTQGANADAVVAAGAAGTLSAKIRRLTTDIGALLTRWPAALGGTTAAASLPVVLSSDGPFSLQTGSITETAPASDTASSGINGRLQRVAQRITSLIAILPAALGAGGGLKIDGSGTALPVSGTVATTVAASAWATFPARITLVAATAQNILAAATATKQVIVYNESSTDTVYLRWDGSAATTVLGFPLAPLAVLSLKGSAVPTAAISAISSGTPTVRLMYA